MRQSTTRAHHAVMHIDHMDGTDRAAMGIWALLALTCAGLLVFALVHWTRGHPVTPEEPQPADDLLDERLVRGEIDEYLASYGAVDQTGRLGR